MPSQRGCVLNSLPQPGVPSATTGWLNPSDTRTLQFSNTLVVKHTIDPSSDSGPTMAAFHEVVNISDEEDSDGSMYDFGRDDSANDNEIEQDVDAMNIDRPNGLGSSGIPTLFDAYETCLNEILEVFPDISHDHVQHIYSRHMESMGPYERQDNTVAQRLVENILDGGNYPKERDRIRELKRKRCDRNNDDEEAAKWKYMDLRNDPAEYAKVAYVCPCFMSFLGAPTIHVC